MQHRNLADWKSRNNHQNATGGEGCDTAGSRQLSWLVLGDAPGQMAQASLCSPQSHTAAHSWVAIGPRRAWVAGLSLVLWPGLSLLGCWVQLSLIAALGLGACLPRGCTLFFFPPGCRCWREYWARLILPGTGLQLVHAASSGSCPYCFQPGAWPSMAGSRQSCWSCLDLGLSE